MLKIAFTGLAVSFLALLACADDASRDPLSRACIRVADVMTEEMTAITKGVEEDQLVAIVSWIERDGQAFFQSLDLLCSDADLESLGLSREDVEDLITEK